MIAFPLEKCLQNAWFPRDFLFSCVLSLPSVVQHSGNVQHEPFLLLPKDNIDISRTSPYRPGKVMFNAVSVLRMILFQHWYSVPPSDVTSVVMVHGSAFLSEIFPAELAVILLTGCL